MEIVSSESVRYPACELFPRPLSSPELKDIAISGSNFTSLQKELWTRQTAECEKELRSLLDINGEVQGTILSGEYARALNGFNHACSFLQRLGGVQEVERRAKSQKIKEQSNQVEPKSTQEKKVKQTASPAKEVDPTYVLNKSKWLTHKAREMNLSDAESSIFFAVFGNGYSVKEAFDKREECRILSRTIDGYYKSLSNIYNKFGIEGFSRGKETKLRYQLAKENPELFSHVTDNTGVEKSYFMPPSPQSKFTRNLDGLNKIEMSIFKAIFENGGKVRTAFEERENNGILATTKTEFNAVLNAIYRKLGIQGLVRERQLRVKVLETKLTDLLSKDLESSEIESIMQLLQNEANSNKIYKPESINQICTKLGLTQDCDEPELKLCQFMDELGFGDLIHDQRRMEMSRNYLGRMNLLGVTVS